MICLDQLKSTRLILIMMIFLQLLWLMVIWITGVGSYTHKIFPILIYTFFTGVLILFVPDRMIAKFNLLKVNFIHHEKWSVLLLCLVAFVTGMIYARFQKIWYDEKCLYHASQIVAEYGVSHFFSNYKEIPWLGAHHPPLIPLIYGLFNRLLGGNLFTVRILSALLATLIVLITYLLGRLYYNREIGLLSAIFLISFPMFFRQASVAMLDIPLLFFFSLALILSHYLCRRPTVWLTLAIGIVIGLGLCTKYQMAFIYPIWFLYFLINRSFGRLKFHIGTIVLVSLGIFILWLYGMHVIDVFEMQRDTVMKIAGISRNSDGVTRIISDWRMRYRIEIIITRLPALIGLYNVPLLFCGCLFLLRHRNKVCSFLICWVLLISIPLIIIFPDSRYFLPVFPALAIIIAYWLNQIAVGKGRIVLLVFLYLFGTLYFFIGWQRTHYLFM